MKLLIPAVLCLAVCAFAQEVPVPPPVVEEPPPEIVEPEYTGPAILSRGGAASVVRGGDLIRLQPFLTIEGAYDTGLTGPVLTPEGAFPDEAAYGGNARFGVRGYHAWRHTVLGLDYLGDLRHYNRKTYYDGFDNTVTMSVVHQFSRRWAAAIGQSFASLSRNSYFMPMDGGLLGVTNFADPSFQNLAGNDLFDNRTNALTSTGRFIFQKSPRLSFSGGMAGYFVRRRSEALIGVDGFTGSGDAAYRLTRFQTIGVDYNFTHFEFKNAFGSSDIHGLALNYAVRLGRFWEFRSRAGAFRVESKRLQVTQIDPAIAAIIGRSSAFSTYHRVVYIPALEFNLTRQFRRSSLRLDYQRLVTPGNGVYLTSGSEAGDIQYTYTATRRLSFAFGIGATTFRSVSENLGKYQNYHGGGGMTYRLFKTVSLVMRADARRYELPGYDFRRTTYHASLGLAFSPGETPLSLW